MECLERECVSILKKKMKRIGSKRALKTLDRGLGLITDRGGGHGLSVVSSGCGSFVFFSLFCFLLFYRAFTDLGGSMGALKNLLFLFFFSLFSS